jgi:hypothetical protein
LPEVTLTDRDQKLLFDIGVQLKFGKRASLLECLLKQLPRYLEDFPVEILSSRHDIIEQLIIFGNSNDSEIKKAMIPTYTVLLSKLKQRIHDLKDERYRNVSESKTSKIALKQTDVSYVALSYPSLDTEAYTKENHELLVRQRPTKFYSFISLVDFTLKNLVNLCTDNKLIADFVELF